MSEPIVADTGPLIACARAGILELLPQLFTRVYVPAAVAAESTVPGQPGTPEIQRAFSAGILSTCPDPATDPTTFPPLGAGELAAITLAQGLRTRLLIDERAGRAAAMRVGLPVLGTGGLLLLAKRQGLLGRLAPILEQIRRNRYYMAEGLVKEILRRAGEGE